MVASKPATYLNWVPDGSPSKQVQPPNAQMQSGWTAGEAPPMEYMNWLFYTSDQWIQWLDQLSSQTNIAPAQQQAMRLINGGSWSYNITPSNLLAWSSAFNLAMPGIPDANNQVAAGSVALTTGQIAYVQANIPFSTTGSTTNGSNQLTSLAYEGGITVGQTITGTGIPGGTTVSSIAGTTITMSANATATNVGTAVVFSGVGALTVSVANESAAVLGPNTVVIARCVTLSTGAAVMLGVGSGQSLLHDGESKLLMDIGYLNILPATAGQTLTKGQWVYISAGATDGSRTAGAVYPVDCSVALGAKRAAAIGQVMTAATVGNPVPIIMNGVVTTSGLTAGAVYYADPATPGGITTTKPATSGQYVVPLGTALTATLFAVNSSVSSDVSQVISINPWPQYAVNQESDFAAAIASVTSGGGGVIVVGSSFSITGNYTLPVNTTLIGRRAGTIITVTSTSGGLTLLGDACEVYDLQLATTVAATLISMLSNHCVLRNVTYQVLSTTNAICCYVSGNSNRLYNNIFRGVLGSATATGIAYISGSSGNIDDSSVFAP